MWDTEADEGGSLFRVQDTVAGKVGGKGAEEPILCLPKCRTIEVGEVIKINPDFSRLLSDYLC